MNSKSVDLIGAIIIIILGLFSFLYHKRIGRVALEQQKKFFNINASEKGYQISFFVGGVLFLVLGILSLARNLQ